MDEGTTRVPRGDIRVSDAERDQAVADLSEHFQAGRLTQEEFEERSGRAFQARTVNDLTALFTDLPRQPPVPAARPGGTATDPALVYGGLRRRGRRLPVALVVIACVIAANITANVFSGGYSHGHFGLLVPLVIIAFVFLRIARHRCRLPKRRRRRLLVTTKTELNAIAAAAIIGLSRPDAASGMAATL